MPRYLVTLVIAVGLFFGFYSLGGNWFSAPPTHTEPAAPAHLGYYKPTPEERKAIDANAHRVQRAIEEQARKDAADKAAKDTQKKAEQNKPVPVPAPNSLPPCSYEDGSGQTACYWDADTQGNGKGQDVAQYGGGSVSFYPETGEITTKD